MTDFITRLQEYTQNFNRELPGFFPLPEGAEKRVVEAMAYSVMNGGKRLRPFLVYASAALFGLDFKASLQTATALEMLHSYSLIHDDLPAMDNDDLRRGRPTCHKQFDEATAILAGDGLLTYAFELISAPATHADPAVRCRLLNLLARQAGAFDGMVAGQMLDLIAEKLPTETDFAPIIKQIEAMKTGALLSYACEAGAILGQADEEQRQALRAYARGIGMAFQITDDILDVVGNQALVGKTLGKDAAQNKVTFVSLYGLEKARELAAELIAQAQKSLEIFGARADDLRSLAAYILSRDR